MRSTCTNMTQTLVQQNTCCNHPRYVLKSCDNYRINWVTLPHDGGGENNRERKKRKTKSTTQSNQKAKQTKQNIVSLRVWPNSFQLESCHHYRGMNVTLKEILWLGCLAVIYETADSLFFWSVDTILRSLLMMLIDKSSHDGVWQIYQKTLQV